MITITITEGTTTREDMAYMLRNIADMIENGYTSGYTPQWELHGDEEPPTIRRTFYFDTGVRPGIPLKE